MKFLDLIISLFSKPSPRKKRAVSTGHTVEPKPTDEVGFYKSGIQKFVAAEYAGAIEDFSKAISMRKNFHRAFYNRGLSKLKIDDNSGANLDFTKAIEIHPKYAKAYLNRGIVKKRLGDAESAKEDFKQAVNIDPQLYSLFSQPETTYVNESPDGIEADALINKPEKDLSANAPPTADSPEDIESKVIHTSENEADEPGFMKALVIESEDEQYASGNAASEVDAEISSLLSAVVDLDGEEVENEFQELALEVEEDESSEKNEIIQDDAEEKEDWKEIKIDTTADDPLKILTQMIEDSFLSDDFSTGLLPTAPEGKEEEKDDISRLPENGNDEKEEDIYAQMLAAADNVEKGDEPGNSGLVSDEENKLSENNVKPKGEAPVEGSVKKKTGSNSPAMEEAENRRVFGQNFTFELPEQSEVKRVAASAANDEGLNYARGFYYRAKQKHKSGDRLGAILDFSNAIEFSPKFSKAFLQKGRVEFELNELADAMVDLTRSIEIKAKNPLAYFYRAMANQKLEKNREALADLTKSILFDPQNPRLYVFRGLLRLNMGNKRRALEDWGRADQLGFKPAKELLAKFAQEGKGKAGPTSNVRRQDGKTGEEGSQLKIKN